MDVIKMIEEGIDSAVIEVTIDLATVVKSLCLTSAVLVLARRLVWWIMWTAQIAIWTLLSFSCSLGVRIIQERIYRDEISKRCPLCKEHDRYQAPHGSVHHRPHRRCSSAALWARRAVGHWLLLLAFSSLLGDAASLLLNRGALVQELSSSRLLAANRKWVSLTPADGIPRVFSVLLDDSVEIVDDLKKVVKKEKANDLRDVDADAIVLEHPAGTVLTSAAPFSAIEGGSKVSDPIIARLPTALDLLMSAVSPSKVVAPISSDPLGVVGQQCLSGELINRDAQLTKAWDIMLERYLPLYNKPCLLASGQMFGAGKTTLGLNLLNFSDPHVESVYQSYSHPFKEKLKTAMFVSIDLSRVAQELPPLPHETLLQQYVGRIVWVKAAKQLFNISEDHALAFWARHLDRNTATISTALTWLDSLIGNVGNEVRRHILFHIDEIGAVFADNSVFGRFFTGESYLELAKLYDLWNVFSPVLGKHWMYFTGKTSWVNDMGGQKLRGIYKVSPSRLQILDLPCFNVNHIVKALCSPSLKVIVERLYQNQSWLQEEGRIEDKMAIVTKIADRIMYYSSGVPRIVNEMAKILSIPSADAAHTAFLMSDDGERKLMMDLKPNINLPVLRTELEDNGGEARKKIGFGSAIRGDAVIAHLYYHACVGTELVKDEPLPYFDLFEPGCRPVDELIDIYSLYCQPTASSKVQIVFPRAWRFFLSATEIFAWNFLRYFDKEITSVSKYWESVVRKSIRYRSYIFSGRSMSQAFPFLTGTCLANVEVKGFPVQELNNQARDTTVKAIIDDSVLGKRDFPRQIIPLDASKFPDSLVVFEEDASKCNPFFASQEKNKGSQFSYRDVMEEIGKVIPLLQATRVNAASNAGNTGVFAFFLTGIPNNEVEAMQGEIVSHVPLSMELARRLEETIKKRPPKKPVDAEEEEQGLERVENHAKSRSSAQNHKKRMEKVVVEVAVVTSDGRSVPFSGIPFKQMNNWSVAEKRAILAASVPEGLEVMILSKEQIHSIIAPEIVKRVQLLAKRR